MTVLCEDWHKKSLCGSCTVDSSEGS